MSKFLRILIAALLIIQIMSLRIREPHEQTHTESQAAGSVETSTNISSESTATQAGAEENAQTEGQGSENATEGAAAQTSKAPIKLNPEESEKFKAWKDNLIPWAPVAGQDLSQKFEKQFKHKFAPKAKELIIKGKLASASDANNTSEDSAEGNDTSDSDNSTAGKEDEPATSESNPAAAQETTTTKTTKVKDDNGDVKAKQQTSVTVASSGDEAQGNGSGSSENKGNQGDKSADA